MQSKKFKGVSERASHFSFLFFFFPTLTSYENLSDIFRTTALSLVGADN